MPTRKNKNRRFTFSTKKSREASVKKHDTSPHASTNMMVDQPTATIRRRAASIPHLISRRDYFLQLEQQLSRLAYLWRSVDVDDPNEALIVEQYQRLLRQMVAEGFGGPLDIDAELPDDLMPDEYLKLHR